MHECSRCYGGKFCLPLLEEILATCYMKLSGATVYCVISIYIARIVVRKLLRDIFMKFHLKLAILGFHDCPPTREKTIHYQTAANPILCPFSTTCLQTSCIQVLTFQVKMALQSFCRSDIIKELI